MSTNDPLKTRRPHYGDVGRIYDLADEWLASTRSPRTPNALIDLVELVAAESGSIAVDLGSYNGKWAEPIVARFGCRIVPLDIVSYRCKTLGVGASPRCSPTCSICHSRRPRWRSFGL